MIYRYIYVCDLTNLNFDDVKILTSENGNGHWKFSNILHCEKPRESTRGLSPRLISDLFFTCEYLNNYFWNK